MDTKVDQKQQWKTIWPVKILKLIAVIQILLTLAIIGLEAGSVAIHPFLATIYGGFFCSIFFILAWISIFTVSKSKISSIQTIISIRLACCNQDSLACAIHTLVQNLLSIGAAIVVIYYDNLFINNPYTCILTFTTNCSSSSVIDSISSGLTSYSTKQTLNKVQIGCASGMMLTNVIYVIIFVVVTIRVCVALEPKNTEKNANSVGPPMGQPFATPHAQPVNPVAQVAQPVNSPVVGPQGYPLALHPPGLQLPSYVAQCPYCYGLMRVG